MNVDPSEVAKFDRLAERWWDPAGEFRTLHDINPLRLGYIEAHAPLAGQRVLDVGAGGGLLCEGMARLGAQVTGIDLAHNALAVARLHLKESGLSVHYECATVEDYAAQHAGTFDVVTCLEMLEHVPDPASVIAACAELVRPGGDLFFSTLNRTPKAWGLAIVGVEYVLNWLPRGTHDYLKFITPAEFAREARAQRLEICDMTGLHYQPFGRRYRLGPGLDVNYLVHARRDAT